MSYDEGRISDQIDGGIHAMNEQDKIMTTEEKARQAAMAVYEGSIDTSTKGRVNAECYSAYQQGYIAGHKAAIEWHKPEGETPKVNITCIVVFMNGDFDFGHWTGDYTGWVFQSGKIARPIHLWAYCPMPENKVEDK